MIRWSLFSSTLLRVALLPLDRPGVALALSLGVAIFAGTVFFAGSLP